MHEQIFINANIVMANQVINGTVRVKDGIIQEVNDGHSTVAGAFDMEGDFLMPGFVELHTDNLEKHITPRPKTNWPSNSAVIAHDGQMAISGITTVLDALRLGDVLQESSQIQQLNDVIDGICQTIEENLLRAEHFLHLRCEVSSADLPEILEPLIDNPRIRMLSLMDHTPGQRQFVSMDAYHVYYQGKYGMSDGEMETFIAERKQDQEMYSEANRRHAIGLAHKRGITLASHDDTTEAHVAEAVDDGITVAEFPTTIEAAKAAHKAGLNVMMGGPNIVRGGSHSGNVSACDLARRGYLETISSDYVPHALLHGAMLLHDKIEAIELPQAINMISKNPAKSVGLDDRGEIAPGKRADLVHVHHCRHQSVVRGVWSQGKRVA